MTSGISNPSATGTAPSRSAEVTLPLDASVDAVWRALTDSRELVNWFPTDAAVDARPGGRFAISWDGQWQWDMTIADFEPLRRLRMIDRQARPFDANGTPLEQAAPVELALEITLEPREGGGTVLRLVHSGFGHGAVWDDELDGVSLGWNVELRGLAHYLAHHRGRTRHVAWAHVTLDASLEHAWQTLTSPAAVVTSGYRHDLTAGDTCTIALATGDVIEGRVVFAKPGRQLLVEAHNLGDALFRLSLDRAAGQVFAQIWLSAWTLPTNDVDAFAARTRSLLASLQSA